MATISGLPYHGRGPAVIAVGGDVFPLSMPSEVMISGEASHSPVMDWSGTPVELYQGARSYSATVTAHDVPLLLVARLMGDAAATSSATGRPAVAYAISGSPSDETVAAITAASVNAAIDPGTYLVTVPATGTAVTVADARAVPITATGTGGFYATAPALPSTRDAESVFAVTILPGGATRTAVSAGASGDRCPPARIFITSDHSQEGQRIQTVIHRAYLNARETKHSDETSSVELAFTCVQDPSTGKVHDQTSIR